MKNTLIQALTTMVAAALWVAGCGSAAEPAPEAKASGSDAAIKQAAAANKHLYIFFYSEDNEATQTLRKPFEAAMAKMANVAQWTALKKDAPAEKALVERLQLQTAPAPWVVVLAPNGAVTMSRLAVTMPEEKLRAAIASPCQQKCLKALQEKKIVVLCAYAKNVGADDPTVKAVNEFKAGAYGKLTEVVRVDPADAAEAPFLKRLNVDPKHELTTVVVFPPRSLVGRFVGPVTKAGLEAAMGQFADACG
ncbi:MAG: hypothetical protein NTW87_09040 [Planctomycetota bacterium]|nr:hypothetical protein [Planctomycetota bacterium]